MTDDQKRIIGDHRTRDEAFVPIPPGQRERFKATMRAMADADGIIRGLPGGDMELVGWPEAWAENTAGEVSREGPV